MLLLCGLLNCSTRRPVCHRVAGGDDVTVKLLISQLEPPLLQHGSSFLPSDNGAPQQEYQQVQRLLHHVLLEDKNCAPERVYFGYTEVQFEYQLADCAHQPIRTEESDCYCRVPSEYGQQSCQTPCDHLVQSRRQPKKGFQAHPNGGERHLRNIRICACSK